MDPYASPDIERVGGDELWAHEERLSFLRRYFYCFLTVCVVLCTRTVRLALLAVVIIATCYYLLYR